MLFVCPAVFVEESDGRCSVLFPDFDCATCVDSLSHANRMAEECLLLQLRTMQDEQHTLPEPSEQTPELLKKTKYTHPFVMIVRCFLYKLKLRTVIIKRRILP